MSVRDQCRLLGVSRSTVYYEACGPKASDLAVMRRLDEQYTATPFYGVERMTAALRRAGIRIGHNRVRRLLRLMGLEALYPKPRLSVPGGPEHRIYPYCCGVFGSSVPTRCGRRTSPTFVCSRGSCI